MSGVAVIAPPTASIDSSRKWPKSVSQSDEPNGDVTAWSPPLVQGVRSGSGAGAV